jgi:hypothetical protein
MVPNFKIKVGSFAYTVPNKISLAKLYDKLVFVPK